MRLIDADPLKDDIVEEGQRSRRYKIGEFWELRRDEIWIVIDRQPTIEERKTGEWINVTNDESLDEEYECSVCGYELFYSNPTKFCPNCGADMRGDET